MNKSNRSIFVMPLALFAVLALGSLLLNGIDYSWSNWQPASCMPAHCFCEALRDGFIRQPIDTYSNLAFVLVGLLVLAIARNDWSTGKRNNLLDSHRAYPILFALAAIVIGGGSFFYHASLTFVGQWFDVMGMYLLATFALVYGYARLRPIRASMFILAYLVMNAMLGYLLIVNPDARRQVFTGMIYAIIALEILYALVERPRIKTRFLVGAVAVLAMAYGIWTLDESGSVCDPTSLWQGHAVWHLLSAVAAWLLFLYYRSENGKLKPIVT